MISAKIIKDSINPQGVRITTLELEYPRIIHAELMTHRVFSRNSASSRAIPVDKVIEMVLSNPAMPVHWGKNQAGMQAREELEGEDKEVVMQLWLEAAYQATVTAEKMKARMAHKQVINRILEPFQWMKVVLTSTEWANWDWLRFHPDADPTIYALAVEVKKARDESIPTELFDGEWHMPYVHSIFDYDPTQPRKQEFFDDQSTRISLEEALKISASSCAQVSYRKSDTSLEKAEVIFSKLIESEPCHASPTEHQAQVMEQFHPWVVGFEGTNVPYEPTTWDEGITHVDTEGNLWSANFRSWIQHRQLIPNNAKYN